MSSWNAAKARGQAFIDTAEKKQIETLLYWDGPQLCTFKQGDRSWLSLRVDDEDDGSTRWLEAPVSKLGILALKCGIEPLRDLLVHEETRMVHEQHGTRHVTLVEPLSLPDDFLPEAGARLPRLISLEAREHMMVTVDSDSSSPRLSSLEFVSPFLDSLRRLWLALYQAAFSTVQTAKGKVANPKPAELFLMHGAPGSLALALRTQDQEIESTIAQTLARTLSLGEDELEAWLVNKDRVRGRLATLLELLDKYEADILAHPRGEEPIYVRSGRIARLKMITNRREPLNVEKATAIGFFESYNSRTGAFRFYDYLFDEAMEGHVVVFPSPVDEVTVGASALYRLLFERRIFERHPEEIVALDVRFERRRDPNDLHAVFDLIEKLEGFASE